VERARREGFPGIVVATDAPFAVVPGVACVGPTRGAAANVSVAAAALDGGDAVVGLRNHGDSGVRVRLRSGGEEREVDVPAGGSAPMRFAAPSRGQHAVYEIVAPRDDLAADDRVEVVRRGGAGRVTFVGGAEACPRLAAAVRATGAETGMAGDGVIEVAYRGATDDGGDAPRFVVAPKASEGGPIRVTSAPRSIRGDDVVARGEVAAVLPASGTTLAVTGTVTGGEPLWSSPDGVLLAATSRVVLGADPRARRLAVLAVDPEDPRSDWHRDPSFPVLVASVLDALADGPDRLDPIGSVPSVESDVVREPRPTSAAEELRSVVRRAADAPDVVRPAPWIAGAAALLLVAAAALTRR
jgi:hypothetical protein